MDIRVAAYGVIVDGDRVLLAHWAERGRSAWTLPGGGIDPGEHPADAAIREIREETGYTADLGELIGVDSHVIRSSERIEPGRGPLHALRIIYTASITGGELTNEIGGSTDRAKWIELSGVSRLNRVGLVDIALTMAGVKK